MVHLMRLDTNLTEKIQEGGSMIEIHITKIIEFLKTLLSVTYTYGGIGHIVAECANNRKNSYKRIDKFMKDYSSESDSDDSFEYTSSSDEETNHIALAVSTPNFSSNLVHRANEGKSKSEVESDSDDDDLSSDLDEITYRELYENI